MWVFPTIAVILQIWKSLVLTSFINIELLRSYFLHNSKPWSLDPHDFEKYARRIGTPHIPSPRLKQYGGIDTGTIIQLNIYSLYAL